MEPGKDPEGLDDNGLMSLGQAAAWLGWRGRDGARRLKRTLKAIERRVGQPILVQAMGEVRGGKYLVTKGAIMRWAPDLCHRDNELSKSFRSHLRQIDRRIDKRFKSRIAETVELQISDLWKFLAQVTESINQLNERVAAITSQSRPIATTDKHIGQEGG